MKVSESWLREWVQPSVSTDELVEKVTMAGLEVDAVEKVAGDFTSVVVGEIVSVEPHPDAQKLRVCQVAGGADDLTQVVCGAPNARAGIKVPFALVGAKLPGGLKIKKAKLRGVESFGMLCGQTELEAGDDDSGLWELPGTLPVGQDLRAALNLDDCVIEMDLTPNRSDCLSVRGVAREVGVLCQCDVTSPSIESIPPSIDDVFSVALDAPEACPQYVGRVIRNVDVSQPAPMWMREKLRKSGIRSIDAVVDVTNYVLLELGQPMHAFDLAKLSGAISVRMAEAGEKIALLNDQDVSLNADTLVIADKSGAIAIAGVMGGASTAVSSSTRDIFLESAFFNPVSIAGKARAYGLHTDSSHRFERGVDPELQALAIERATALLIDIVGGEAGPLVSVKDEAHFPQSRTVSLNYEKLTADLGLEIPQSDVDDMLSRLGLKRLGLKKVANANEVESEFSVPSFRFDIAITADLTEEVARIYGYDRLPVRLPDFAIGPQESTEKAISLSAIKRHLVARDYDEVISYSFIDPKLHVLFSDEEAVALRNPISADMALMRTSLVPGLVKSLLANIARQQSRVRLFESGLRFSARQEPNQQTQTAYPQTPGLSGLIMGGRDAIGWSSDKTDCDFYDLKGDLESVLGLGRDADNFRFEASKDVPAFLHPGQSAMVKKGGRDIGYIGALHPSVAASLDIPKSVYVYEIDLDAILDAKVPAYTPISRFPEVSRDLAVVVDKGLPVAELTRDIDSVVGDSLKSVALFDVYEGESIGAERKSLAFSLTFQASSRTLTEEEINEAMASVVQHLESEHGATLR